MKNLLANNTKKEDENNPRAHPSVVVVGICHHDATCTIKSMRHKHGGGGGGRQAHS